MLIRRAEITDIPDILRLLVQVCNVHQAIRPDIFRRDGVKYTEADLRELLPDDSRPVWCALEGERFLGYCFCQWEAFRDSSVMTDRRELYIDDLCVDENCRGQHVGKALYEHTCAYARQIGCRTVTLNVWCGNDSAMAFYEKRGLKPRKIYMEAVL